MHQLLRMALLAMVVARSIAAMSQTLDPEAVRDPESRTPAMTAQAPAASDLGAVTIGSAASASIMFTFGSTETLGSIAVLTQGAPGKDFTNGGGGTCTAGKSFNPGDKCTVIVRFTPKVAGTRSGAVLLKEPSGKVFATAFVHGSGLGPQMAFNPAVQTPLPISHVLPNGFGIAVDGTGNVYLADSTYERVIEIPRTADGYGEEILLASGLGDNIYGLAVDGAGNLFFGEPVSKLIMELPWTGSGWGALTTVAKGQPNVCCIGVDGSGDLYFTEWNNNQAHKLPWTGTGYGTPVTVPTSGLSTHLFAIAADVAGSVYVADSSCDAWGEVGCVWKIPLSNSGYGPQVKIATGLNSIAIDGLAVDGVGNVYIADTYYNRVVEAPWNGSSYGSPIELMSGDTFFALAVDGAGNVYSNKGGRYPTMLSVSAPPALSFATTAIGATSSDSPQLVEVENIGNAPLEFPIPATGTNPNTPKDFTSGSSGTCPLVTSSNSVPGKLAAGENCTILMSFTPKDVGAISEPLVLMDNALNLSGAQQEIQLNGIAVKAGQTISFPQPSSPVTYGVQPLTLFATASSGLAVAYSVASGPAKVSGHALTITGAGTVVVAANQPGNATYAAAPQVTRSITARKAAQTIAFTPPPSPVVYGVNPFKLLATASSGQGITFSVSSGPAKLTESWLTITGTGTVVVAAIQPGNANYAAAPRVTHSITVNRAKLTATANNLSMKKGATIPALTYALTGFVDGDTQATATTGKPALSTTATSTSPAGSYPITITAGTLASKNYSVTYVNGKLTVTN